MISDFFRERNLNRFLRNDSYRNHEKRGVFDFEKQLARKKSREMTVTDEEKDLNRQMIIERERLRNISGTVSQFEQIRRDAVLEIEKQQEEQLNSQKKLEDYEKQLRDLTTKRQKEELKKLKEELETLLVDEKNDVEEAKKLFTKLSKRNEMIERVKNDILKKKQQLKANNIEDTSTDEIIKNIETTRARKFSFLVRVRNSDK